MLEHILNNNLLQTVEVADVCYQLAEQPDGDSDYDPNYDSSNEEEEVFNRLAIY